MTSPDYTHLISGGAYFARRDATRTALSRMKDRVDVLIPIEETWARMDAAHGPLKTQPQKKCAHRGSITMKVLRYLSANAGKWVTRSELATFIERPATTITTMHNALRDTGVDVRLATLDEKRNGGEPTYMWRNERCVMPQELHHHRKGTALAAVVEYIRANPNRWIGRTEILRHSGVQSYHVTEMVPKLRGEGVKVRRLDTPGAPYQFRWDTGK